MGNEIQWMNAKENLSNVEIKYVEDYFKVTFPEDYTNCIKKFDGAYPLPNAFFIGDDEETFNNLLTLHKHEKNFLINMYENIKDRIIVHIVPFARDPFGNLICFDYRNGDVPSIVLWNHEVAFSNKEKAITFICNSFSDLLGMLHEAEDDE